MVWGKNRYVLLISNILLLADTGEPFNFKMVFQPSNDDPVWGWVSAGKAVASLAKISPMYLWSVFAMNIIVTAMTGIN